MIVRYLTLDMVKLCREMVVLVVGYAMIVDLFYCLRLIVVGVLCGCCQMNYL